MSNQIGKIQRKSYSIKQKLDAISFYKPNEIGNGFEATSKKTCIPIPNLKRWYNQRHELIKLMNNTEVQIKKSRRVPGGGRKAEYEELETILLSWIHSRNQKGLRIKDKYIQIKAQAIKKEFVDKGETKYEAFLSSTGWCERFKSRHKLVARRQTTARVLPEDVNNIIMSFHQTVFDLIEMHKILPRNIINFDQVPRYFESEHKSTITTKGIRNVLLRKASSSHKRFTVTFAINMEGKIFAPHLLFSKLSKKPSVCEGCFVDVNKTGMWNDEILINYIDNIITKRPETTFYRQPTLLLIDHYGPHVTLATSKRLEKYNIFIILIPANLTAILQPLDVSINRSFQEFYNTEFDAYIADALEDKKKQTKAGNPKIPSYLNVSQWVSNWVKTQTKENIKKAFKICGIGAKDDFCLTELHKPLHDILSPKFDSYEWFEIYGDLLTGDCYFDEEVNDWFWPPTEVGTDIKTSFFQCIMHAIQQTETNDFLLWLKSFIPEVMKSLEENPELKELCDDEDRALIEKGHSTTSGVEIKAVSIIQQWRIRIIELNEECVKVEERLFEPVSELKKDILLVNSLGYFGMKI